MSAAENPIFDSSPVSAGRLLPEYPERVLPETIASWAWWLGTARAWTEGLLSVTYHRTRYVSENLAAALQRRSRRIREREPIQLLGIVAASAFAVGAGAAIWRSHR